MLDRDAFTRILGSIESNLNMDYEKEFDMRMQALRSHKRTFSQIFDNNLFQEIQQNLHTFCNVSQNLQSCNTILHNEEAGKSRTGYIVGEIAEQQSHRSGHSSISIGSLDNYNCSLNK